MQCFTRIYCYIGVSNLILFLDCGKYFKSMSKFYFQQFFFKYILFVLPPTPSPPPASHWNAINLPFGFCFLFSVISFHIAVNVSDFLFHSMWYSIYCPQCVLTLLKTELPLVLFLSLTDFFSSDFTSARCLL